MEDKIYKHQHAFKLESGVELPKLEIAYSTLGTLNSKGDNVVWVFHALTANQHPFEWWPGLFGPNDYFNDNNYFTYLLLC